VATLTTEAQVCNLALGMVGQRQLIDGLADSSTEAQACAAFYATSRDECLGAYRWRLNQKRAVLALSTEERSGWNLVYVAPADMLIGGARYIWDGSRATAVDLRIPFSWEPNDAGTGFLILTDEVDAELVYGSMWDTVALWTPAFITAVASRLAVNLAFMLPVKPDLARGLEPKAMLALQRAAAQDANAGQYDIEPDSEIIRARG